MHKRAMSSCGVCLCVSVCPSRSWVAWKRIKISSKFFHHRVPYSQAILVFPCQTGWRYSDGNTPNGGVECRWGRKKTRFWTKNLASLHRAYRSTVLSTVRVAKCEKLKIKAATNGDKRRAEHSRARGVRRSHKTTTKCFGRARRYTPKTEIKPLGHNWS